MSNDNKRPMTPKMFLFKAGTKAANSAIAFIQSYRSFLETGELCEVTSPILARIDSREIMPTVGLEEIKAAVMAHSIRKNAEEAERKLMASLDAESAGGSSKNWISTIFDSKGQVVLDKDGKELSMSFDLASMADRWTDRKLFESASDTFGVIQSNRLFRANGDPISTVVMRADAIARILKIKKGPMSKKTGSRDSALSFGVKAHQDHAHFSRG